MSYTFRFIATLIVLPILWGSLEARATGKLIGDPVAGKEKAAACEGCHGEGGNSAVADFPRLAGQYAGYIVKQVREFQQNIRANNDTMGGIAAGVDLNDEKDVASYFSQQPLTKDVLHTPNKALVAKGEQLFVEGNAKAEVYACINCHGERGKGRYAWGPKPTPTALDFDRYACLQGLKDKFKAGKAIDAKEYEECKVAQFPVLGGQHKDYLTKQLREFRNGRKLLEASKELDGASRANDPGNMMGDIAKRLSDEDIEALAEYLAVQGGP